MGWPMIVGQPFSIQLTVYKLTHCIATYSAIYSMHPIQIICPTSPIQAISCLHQIQAVLWTKLRNNHLVLTRR
jgi:hypothetical protein